MASEEYDPPSLSEYGSLGEITDDQMYRPKRGPPFDPPGPPDFPPGPPW